MGKIVDLRIKFGDTPLLISPLNIKEILCSQFNDSPFIVKKSMVDCLLFLQ